MVELDTLICGDARELLQDMENDCIDCCITSPPYYNLRTYGMDGELGSENTIDDYINDLYGVVSEIGRVLKPTGTLWLNLGDSYGSGYGQPHLNKRKPSDTAYQYNKPAIKGYNKSLMCIPFRFITKLVDTKFKLRNTIIWHKPNAMPDSARDRFVNDFDYLFFLVKQNKYSFETQYEPYQSNYENYTYNGSDTKDYESAKAQSPSDSKRRILASMQKNPGRRRRCVWRIKTKPFQGAHFATFPEDLLVTPIEAGCPVGGVVLDPFVGSGTSCVVAKKLGRHYIGMDLKEEYIEMSRKRLEEM